MARRPRIGITGAARRWSPSWWCSRLAVALAGGQAIRISVRHRPAQRDFDGLIIGGGDDIHPEHYGGELDNRVRLDPERDALELGWIRWALEHDKPLLGICRGAQLINVELGGNLHQDIRQMRIHTYNRPGLLPTKQVALLTDSRVARICGKSRLRVNSLHHQAVDAMGQGLQVVGRDLDHITQAYEHSEGQKIIGVQWHPEYLFYLPSQWRLFRWLVGAARG